MRGARHTDNEARKQVDTDVRYELGDTRSLGGLELLLTRPFFEFQRAVARGSRIVHKSPRTMGVPDYEQV